MSSMNSCDDIETDNASDLNSVNQIKLSKEYITNTHLVDNSLDNIDNMLLHKKENSQESLNCRNVDSLKQTLSENCSKLKHFTENGVRNKNELKNGAKSEELESDALEKVEYTKLEDVKTIKGTIEDKVKEDVYCDDSKNKDMGEVVGSEKEKGLENIWNTFINFETYTFDPDQISFTEYLTEWQRRLNEVIECGLHYSETVLSLKLVHNCNLKPDARLNIFNTIYSHLETNILLFTLSALNNIKNEDSEKEGIKEENEDCTKSNINNVTSDDEHFHELEPEHLEDTEHEHLEDAEHEHLEDTEYEHLEDTEYEHLEDAEHEHLEDLEQNPEFSLNEQSLLDDPMIMQEGKSKINCELCDKIFFSDKTLKLHKKSVHKKHLSCDHCFKLFDRQSKLTKHKETHAKRLAATQGLFQCDQCGVEMQGKKRLRIHKRTHFQFRCKPCNKIFKDKDLLNRHVLNHQEYPCVQCGLVFYQQALLVKHLNTITHGGERKFACDLCGKTFMKKYNLQTHQLTHTGEKKFRCDFQDCAMAFYKKDVMTRHMRIHTGEKPYQCDVCQRRFTQSGDLRKHSRTHASDRNSL